MITAVELGNFLSHSATKLDFEKGVTVFVGHNGAGKSSIIDAITFALFGQHTRKSNKGLIRRGTNQGYAKINFSVNGHNYEAVRKIDTKGTLSAQFLEKKNGKVIPLAAGERKQFGESMTKQIESCIGLDFDKLKIASIVQQGELNSIIKAKPKEFKELVNAVIGIDKLDVAFELMKAIQKNFRESIQKKIGYDDTHIDILKKDLKMIETELAEAEPTKQKLFVKKKNYEKELLVLQEKIEKELPKEIKLKELERQKNDLISYAKEAILSLQNEIKEKERKVHDCEGCFEYVNFKKDTETQLQKVRVELKDVTNTIKELSIQEGILEDREALAEKLVLKDGKCPVCDSKVDHLNPLFEEDHLRQESISIRNQIVSFEKKREQYLKNENDLEQKLQEVIDAESTLRAHSIRKPSELDSLKQEIYEQKNHIQKIPTINSGKLIEIATIDSRSKLLYEKIKDLEKETRDFEPHEFNKLKTLLEGKRLELSDADQQYGAIIQKISRDKEQFSKINLTLKELQMVRLYVLQLEQIQNNIFNRDGPVATSLRSWALQTISVRTSEYLSMLNTKIHRITLSEKTRDVSITCYSKNTALDLDSLSGGEQVSVALALRLGMAHLLGASNLNFVILDEPTAHLDEERRKSLVNVLSHLSNATHMNSKLPLQFIIITHDAEIFENSNIDRIYKFSSTPHGTEVVSL